MATPRPALPANRVSRNRPLSDVVLGKQGSMARIQEGDNVIGCSCGWANSQPRAKVRGDAAERHVDKRHGGRAIWL